MRLADRRNRLDVDAMMAELTCEQFDEWQGFMRLEPTGGRVDDERWSMLLALVSQHPEGPAIFAKAYQPPPPVPTTSEIIARHQRT